MSNPTNAEIVPIAAAAARPDARIEALLDDAARNRAMRRTLAAVVGLVGLFLVWSLLTQVDELARARGEVLPSGNLRVLQSELGGTILRLAVREGDRVEAGQVIADFAATDLTKLRAQVDVRLAAAEIDSERLQSVLEERAPDLSRFEAEHPRLVIQARAAYEAEMARRRAVLDARRSDEGQQQELLIGVQRSMELLRLELREAGDRLARLEEGTRGGVVPQNQLSEARQQFAALQEREAELAARGESLRRNIEGLESDLDRLRAEMNEETSLALSDAIEQLAELRAEKAAISERQGRADLRAPVDGIVINLPHTRVGAVVPPGGVVAEIVPTGEELLMEVRVSPRDIGFVRVGQDARVKVDSYDYARFGSVAGEVVRVAPTSTSMRDGEMPFYKVQIALATDFVGHIDRRLIPGMTGEADIVTGRKSVIQYLLKPIFLASDTAFHER